MTYERALNDPNYSFGHSLVLCALLEGVDLSALRVWNCNRLDKSAFWTSRLSGQVGFLDKSALGARLVSAPAVPG